MRIKMEITCSDLCINYGNNIALDKVNFEIKSGDYLYIIGENGSGKSTLLKGILGLQPLKSGKVSFIGFRKDSIGYLNQQTSIQKDFPASVFEVVLSGVRSKNRFLPFYSKEDKKTALKNMEKLKIDDLKNKSYLNLSGGQQQRVLLARALCATDGILFLDEPVTGLDPKMTFEFYELLYELNKKDNLTIVMTSHDTSAALKYSTKILHLETEVLYFGTTNNYLKTEAGSKFLGI